MLGCVSGRVHHLEFDIAHHEGITIFEQRVAVFRGIGVLPIFIALIGQIEVCPDTLGQFTRSR